MPEPAGSPPLRIPTWCGTGRAAPPPSRPLFLLYDYTFRPDGAHTKEGGLAIAYETGIVCSDEMMLHPDPYPSAEAWCAARIETTVRRLAERDPDLPVVFVSHYPLVREPTRILRYPQFAQWCGTTRTNDWHLRYNASTVVYGHLHIPRVTWHDGVRFVEASIGYPREWRRRTAAACPATADPSDAGGEEGKPAACRDRGHPAVTGGGRGSLRRRG